MASSVCPSLQPALTGRKALRLTRFPGQQPQPVKAEAPAMSRTPEINTARQAAAAEKGACGRCCCQGRCKPGTRAGHFRTPQPVAVASDPRSGNQESAAFCWIACGQTADARHRRRSPGPCLQKIRRSASLTFPPVAAEHNPAPRMPRVEDFPPIAQREIQAKQQTAPLAQPQQPVAQQRPQQPAPAPSYEETR